MWHSVDACSRSALHMSDYPLCGDLGELLWLGRGGGVWFSLGVPVGPMSTQFAGPPPLTGTLIGEWFGWLPLSGLPCIPACLACIMQSST